MLPRGDSVRFAAIVTLTLLCPRGAPAQPGSSRSGSLRSPKESHGSIQVVATPDEGVPGSNVSLAPALRALPRSSDQAMSRRPAVRWAEGDPGCTFSQGTDGKLRYGLWRDDVGITLAVDTQELSHVHRRHEPFFALLLEYRYRGAAALDVSPDNVALEFVSHVQTVQSSLDPDLFARKLQSDADEFDHQITREVKKHPEKKAEKEADARAFQKDTAELVEFIGRNSLRPGRLDAGNPNLSGWVLFSTNGKWIGKWKKEEQFLLRVPLEGKTFEFPFTLPPKPGEGLLRKRE